MTLAPRRDTHRLQNDAVGGDAYAFIYGLVIDS